MGCVPEVVEMASSASLLSYLLFAEGLTHIFIQYNKPSDPSHQPATFTSLPVEVIIEIWKDLSLDPDTTNDKVFNKRLSLFSRICRKTHEAIVGLLSRRRKWMYKPEEWIDLLEVSALTANVLCFSSNSCI